MQVDDMESEPRASADRAPWVTKGLSFRDAAQRKLGSWTGDAAAPSTATPLTAMARALYEGRVAPVREIARLCGVSVVTLYHHAKKRGWTMRNKPPVKGGATPKARRRALRNAQRPKAPGGLKARDAAGEARSRAACEGAEIAAAAALQRAIAMRDADVEARNLAAQTRLMLAEEGVRAPRRSGKAKSGGRKSAAAKPPRATLYEREMSDDELRADLSRKIEGLIAEREPARPERSQPAPADMPAPAPARPPSPMPHLPSARERRAEVIIARLRALRSQRW